MEKRRNLAVVDLDTDELVEGVQIRTQEQQLAIAKAKTRQEVNLKYRNYGNFYWLLYTAGEKIFDGKISGATITRYIYLCTFVGYAGNQLVWDNGKPIHKKDLQGLLKLSEKQYLAFIKECKENNMLTINNDDSVTIGNVFIGRGKLQKKTWQNNDVMRLYINGVRYLYNNSNPSGHKTLGYLFALLPYVNLQYNVICHNPYVTDMDAIIPMDITTMCSIVGYNPSNARKLKNVLMDITVRDKPAIRWIGDRNGDTIYVNPAIYYAGDRHDEVKILGKF